MNKDFKIFDWLDIIKRLKSKGLTQQEIGDKIGFSKEMVSYYNAINREILTPVLEYAKDHQKGRVNEELTNVNFNFTEGWFRSSGLYDLNPLHQLGALRWFMFNNVKQG